MPRTPRWPAPLVGKVFCASDVIARGLLTRDDLRTSAWRPVLRNVYADSRLHVTHRIRCLAAARWLLDGGAAIAGRSAALLHGGLAPADGSDVEVLTTPDRRRNSSRGLRIHTDRWWDGRAVRIAGVAVTDAERTCWDLASWYDVVEAVTVIDTLLATGATTVPALLDYADARIGRRGARQLHRAASLADPGAESPQESRLRVRLVLAGLPRPATQHVIRDGSRFVARVDLAWPELKVAVEYDGRWHDRPDQFERDRGRLNRLRAAGWIVLHVTAGRLRDDFDGFVVELRAALRDAKRRLR